MAGAGARVASAATRLSKAERIAVRVVTTAGQLLSRAKDWKSDDLWDHNSCDNSCSSSGSSGGGSTGKFDPSNSKIFDSMEEMQYNTLPEVMLSSKGKAWEKIGEYVTKNLDLLEKGFTKHVIYQSPKGTFYSFWQNSSGKVTGIHKSSHIPKIPKIPKSTKCR